MGLLAGSGMGGRASELSHLDGVSYVGVGRLPLWAWHCGKSWTWGWVPSTRAPVHLD